MPIIYKRLFFENENLGKIIDALFNKYQFLFPTWVEYVRVESVTPDEKGLDELASTYTDWEKHIVTLVFRPLFFDTDETMQERVFIHEIMHTYTAALRSVTIPLVEDNSYPHKMIDMMTEVVTENLAQLVRTLLDK